MSETPYARLLEKNLLTYELQGVTFNNGEEIEVAKKRTGAVVACLDTSDSMEGASMLKAKALLLAIANILKQEDRSLHVLLFGASGEIHELSRSQAPLGNAYLQALLDVVSCHATPSGAW